MNKFKPHRKGVKNVNIYKCPGVTASVCPRLELAQPLHLEVVRGRVHLVES